MRTAFSEAAGNGIVLSGQGSMPSEELLTLFRVESQALGQSGPGQFPLCQSLLHWNPEAQAVLGAARTLQSPYLSENPPA